MATVYGTWFTRNGFNFRSFLTYTETNSDTTYSINYSCGVQASGGDTATRQIGVKVLVTGASETSWKTITMSRSSTTQTYTAYTDTVSWTKSKSAQTKTIKVSLSEYVDGSYVSKTFTVSAKTSYPVTYNANSGSGAPTQQTKWYGEALTLSSAKPTKDGYTFKGWATSEAGAEAGTVNYASGGTVAANTNSALTLWAVWELTYSKPTITNLHIERCDAQGVADDEGTLALVTFDWSVFRTSAARYYNGSTTPYISTTVQSCSVTVGSETETPTLAGASGSESVVVGSAGSFLTDAQYNASVAITDTVDSSIQPSHSSTVTGTLSTTFFPMDFNADATALGFFKPAPDNGDGVYFGKSINVSGDIMVSGNVMAQGMAGMIQMYGGSTAPTGWLLCNGSAVSRTDYAELFAVIGTNYGAGDGTTTFNLPDMRGMFPLGVSSTHPITGTGSSGGAETVKLTAAQSGVPAHNHGASGLTVSPSGHKIKTNSYALGSGGTSRNIVTSSGSLSSDTVTDGHSISGSVANNTATDATSAHNNMPPYRTVNFIIATGKTS